MTLTEAIRLAAERGCEIAPADTPGVVTIRAIGYDADPFELPEARLLALTREEFLREWIPERL